MQFLLDFTTCHAAAGEERPDQDHKCKRLHHSKYRLAKVRQWWHFLSMIRSANDEINLVFRNMWDNMSGFWRMQCADDSFEITAKVRLENPDFEFIVIKL